MDTNKLKRGNSLFGDIKQKTTEWLEKNNANKTPAEQPVQQNTAEVSAPVAPKEVYPGKPKTEPPNPVNYSGRNNAVSDIMKYKRWYDDAKAAGDTAAMENAHNNAMNGYNWLNSHGYDDDAKALEGMNYAASKKWATDGMTQTRPYFYNAGKAYGLSNKDIDNLITYDNLTRNIYFGGTNLGSADLTIDGVAYWKDPSVLESAFNDYLKRTNTTMTDENMSRKHSASIDNKINEMWGTSYSNDEQFYDYFKKYMDTVYGGVSNDADYNSIYGKIMEPYNLEAIQGRNRTAAAGAANNGGYMDSYSALNAAKQEAYIKSLGQQTAHQAGMDAYNTKMNNIYKGLESLGVYFDNSEGRKSNIVNQQQNEAQRLFENVQAAKKNATEIEGYKAEITGNNPLSWTLKNDPTIGQYFNNDGSLNRDAVYGTDFTTMIAKAQESGASDQVINALKYMRGLKGTTYYEDFGDDIKDGNVSFSYDPGKTSSHYLEEKGIDSAENIAMEEMKHNAGENEADRKHELTVMDKAHEQEKEFRNQDREWQKEDRDYTASRTGSSGGSSGGSGRSSGGGANKSSSGGKAPMTEAQVDGVAKDLNETLSSQYGEEYIALVKDGAGGKYKKAGNHVGDAWIISKVMESNYTDAQKDYLLYDCFGITPEKVQEARTIH